MSICPKCNYQVADNSSFCSVCGTAVQPQAYGQQPVYRQTPPASSAPVEDSGSFGWAVLGFFIPVAGLILWLVWKDNKPLSAHKAGVGALVSVIISVVLGILSFIATFAFTGLMFAAI